MKSGSRRVVVAQQLSNTRVIAGTKKLLTLMAADALGIRKPSLEPFRDAVRKVLVAMLERAERGFEVLTTLQRIDAGPNELSSEARCANILGDTAEPHAGRRIKVGSREELAPDHGQRLKAKTRLVEQLDLEKWLLCIRYGWKRVNVGKGACNRRM
ncbi:MAG: hypothetical protein AAF160_18595 [Pseudomonadota bacterium]